MALNGITWLDEVEPKKVQEFRQNPAGRYPCYERPPDHSGSSHAYRRRMDLAHRKTLHLSVLKAKRRCLPCSTVVLVATVRALKSRGATRRPANQGKVGF